MKQKGKDILFFEELMDRAHFAQPASKEAKADALKSEKAMLKKVLKEAGQWSLTLGVLLILSHVSKKLKMLVLANKILSAVTVVSLGIGTYYTVEYINNQNAIMKQLNIVNVPAEMPRQVKTVSLNIKNKIELQEITSTSVDEELLTSINSNITKELDVLKTDRIIRQVKEDDNEIKYIIFGNVEDMGDSIQFYIKIIDKETSEVINVFNKVISKKADIKQECRNISRNISPFLK